MSTLPKLRPLTRDSAFFVVGANEGMIERLHEQLISAANGRGVNAKTICQELADNLVHHIEWLNKETAENEAAADA